MQEIASGKWKTNFIWKLLQWRYICIISELIKDSLKKLNTEETWGLIFDYLNSNHCDSGVHKRTEWMKIIKYLWVYFEDRVKKISNIKICLG